MKTKLHLIASQRFFSTIESAKTRIGMALKSLLLMLAIANTGLACADITEFVGSVEAVDIEKGGGCANHLKTTKTRRFRKPLSWIP